MTIEGDVPVSYEGSLYNLPEFRCGQSINNLCGFLQIRICLPSTLCSSRGGRPFSGPPVAMANPCTRCRFQSIVDIFSANSFFFLSISGISFSLGLCRRTKYCQFKYRFKRNVHHTISGFGQSRVSRTIFSFASSARLSSALHFSKQRGRLGVGLSQNASIPSCVGLFAGCAMMYAIKFR